MVNLITRNARLLVAASLLISNVSVAAGTVIRREAAGGYFEHRDSSGCVLTTVDITGLREYISGSGESTPAASFAETFITRKNQCTGVELLRASESGAQTVTFTPNALSRAFLDGSFNLYDYVTSQLYVIEVHIVWEGTGKVSQTETPSQTHTVRDATATGSLIMNGENLIPVESSTAAIERIRTRN